MSAAANTKKNPIPNIISVDDHLVEPPHLWQSRLPEKYKDAGPRVVNAPKGEFKLIDGVYAERPGTGDEMAAWWHYEDHIYQLKQMIACPGMPPEEVKAVGVTFDDIRTACYDPKERVVDMKANHVEGSLCFPNYPRFCGQMFGERKDKELSKLCVEAYNDFQVEEWAGDSDGHLIPLCIVPLWDAKLAAAEVIFSGKLEQFPKLKLLYAECQIGWIPYFVERADDTWHTHQWAQGENQIPKPPSHYYKENVYSCFFKDTVGIALLDRIGVDHVMFETDYPHQDGTFPNSKQVAEDLFGHLDPESIYKIARGNAIKLLDLDIAE